MVKTSDRTSFSIEEHDEISAAIHSAEQTTSGEIYAVFTRESDTYFFTSCFVWTLTVFIAAILVAFWLHWSWHDVPLHYFGAGMLLVYLVGLFYLSILPGLRLAMTPASLKKRICHNNAVKQFLAQNVHRTSNRTAILLFVSLAEHYAEVIADTAIAEKVSQSTWDSMIRRMIQQAQKGELSAAYVEAINHAGTILASHFPPSEGSLNELPDHIVEL